MTKHLSLLKVDGAAWEAVGLEGAGSYCLSVDIGQDMLCVWAHKPYTEYLCIKYQANAFTGKDQEQWLGPLETLCLIEEALKEAASIRETTKSSTST